MDDVIDPIKDRKRCECEKEATYSQQVAKMAEELAMEEVDFNMAEQKIMDTLTGKGLLHDAGQREIVDLQMRYEQQDEEYQKLKVEGRTKILKWWKVLQTLDNGIQSHRERTAEDLRLHRAQRLQLQARVDTLEPQLVRLTATIRTNQNTRNIELNTLKDQVQAAEEANVLCHSLRNRADRYQQIAMGMSEAKVQSTEQELLAARSKNEQNKRTLDSLIQENRELTSLIAQNDEELKSMESDYSNKMAEINSIKFNNELSISKYESEIESLNTCILNQTNFTRTILDENVQVQESICDLENKHQEHIKETEELNKQIEEMNNSMNLTMTKIAMLDGGTCEGDDRTEKKAGLLTVLKERIESLTTDIAHHDEQIACEQKTFDEEKASLLLQINQCTTENATVKSVDTLEEDVAKMAKDIAELEKHQQSYEQKRAQEIAHLTGIIEDRTASVASLKDEVQRLEFEVGVASSTLEEQKLVEVNQAKESDAVSGKLSSLRKQLAIEEAEEKKWAKAIEKLKKAILTYKNQSEHLNDNMRAQDANASQFDKQRARRKAELVAKVAQMDKEAAKDDETIEKMEAKQTNLNDEYNRMQEEHRLQMSTLNKELAELQQAADTNATRISNLQTELRNSNDVIAKAAAEYDALLKQICTLRNELNEEAATKTSQKGKENTLPVFTPPPTSIMKHQPKPIGKSVHFSMPPLSKRHVYDYSSDSDADGGLGNPRNLWPRRPTHPPSKRRKSTTDTQAALGLMKPPGRHNVWRSLKQQPSNRTQGASDTPLRERPTRDTKK